MHPFQRQFRIGLGTFGLHLPFKVLDPSDDVRLAIDLREHVRVVDMPLELLGEPMVGLCSACLLPVAVEHAQVVERGRKVFACRTVQEIQHPLFIV